MVKLPNCLLVDGIVRVQLYQGTQLAVKEFLPKPVVANVMLQASILAYLCRPYLPLIFGVCTQKQFIGTVMQFYSFEGVQPLKLCHELQNHFSGRTWVLLVHSYWKH